MNSKASSTAQSLEKASYYAVLPQYKLFAYISDWVVIISIATLICAALSEPPMFYQVLSNVAKIHSPLIPTGYGGFFEFEVFIALFVSYAYFLLDSLYGTSLSKLIMGIRTVKVMGKKGETHSDDQSFLSMSLLRALIKALPPLILVDLAFSKRNIPGRSRVEQISGITSVSSRRRIGVLRVSGVSAIIYFLPLLTMTLIVGFTNMITPLPTPPPTTHFTYVASLSESRFIATSNWTFDFFNLFIGGATFFLTDIVQIFSSSYSSSLYLGGSLSSYPSFLIYGVFPHFFIETSGYVFGISGAFYLMGAIITFFYGFYRRLKFEDVFSSMFSDLKWATLCMVVSTVLIVIASVIEAYVTPYFLSHYYYDMVTFFNLPL